MASASAIPNLADDDEASESTLVGTLAPEDTLVGTLPKAPGIEDDEDDTALDSTLVGDPWDRTDASSRPSEVRALRPPPRATEAPPRPRRESVTPRPKSAPAKPIATRAAPKPTVPRASTKEQVQRKPASVLPPPPPLPAPASFVPTAPLPSETAPGVTTEATTSAGAVTDADDDASLRRLAASPIARTAEVLIALTLFVAYLCRASVEGLVRACRPLWARASRDAATRVYRR